jgi:hypothetical protein
MIAGKCVVLGNVRERQLYKTERDTEIRQASED